MPLAASTLPSMLWRAMPSVLVCGYCAPLGDSHDPFATCRHLQTFAATCRHLQALEALAAMVWRLLACEGYSEQTKVTGQLPHPDLHGSLHGLITMSVSDTSSLHNTKRFP